MVQKYRERSDMILMGDFNYGTHQKNKRRHIAFKTMMDTLNLTLKTPKTHTNKVRGGKQTQTTIDYFAVSERIECGKIIVHYRDTFPLNTSTHFPISIEVTVPCNPTEAKQQAKKGPEIFKRKKVDWGNFDDHTYKMNLEKRLRYHLEEYKEDNIETQLAGLIDLMVFEGHECSFKSKSIEEVSKQKSMNSLGRKIITKRDLETPKVQWQDRQELYQHSKTPRRCKTEGVGPKEGHKQSKQESNKS